MLRLDGGEAQPPPLLFRHIFISVVHNARHGSVVCLVASAFIVVVSSETTHAGAPPSTAASALAVPGQGIATSKLAIAFGTNVRLLTGMQLTVPLEVVKPSKAHLTFLAHVGLFLAMRKKMTFQIVMAGEFCVAEWTFVFLGRWRPGREVGVLRVRG